MAEEEKPHAPSARKIRKAREDGSVAKSTDLVGFVGLFVGFALMYVVFPYWVSSFKRVYTHCVSLFGVNLDVSTLFSLSMSLLETAFLCVLPFFVSLMIAGVLGNVGQFGFLLSFKVLQPKIDKINPVKGAKNLFSLKKLLDGLMITLKVVISFGVGFVIFLYFLQEIPGISLGDLFAQIHWFYQKSLILVGSLLLLFLLMGIMDFIIRRYQYIKGLKMTKQEVKDEFKQQEGNQEVKAKIRQLMMKNSMNRMMKSISEASVVVTNPTHYAVAIRYDRSKEDAPVVIAKGIDHLALRIKGIAREHEILIVENPPLARELYRVVDVDKMIPYEMFEAIIVLFKEVERLERQRGRLPSWLAT